MLKYFSSLGSNGALGRFLVLLPFFCAVVVNVNNVDGQTTVEQPAKLEVGVGIDRDIDGGQKQLFELSLVEGQQAILIAKELEHEIAVSIFDPDGKLITTEDGTAGSRRVMTLKAIAEKTGSYHVEVALKALSSIKGRYNLTLQDVKTATEQDKSVQLSSELLLNSLQLSNAGKYQEALPLVLRAIDVRKQALGDDDPAVAVALNRAGILYFSLEQNDKAADYFKQSIDILEKKYGKDDLAVADPLNNLSVIYKLRGDFELAEETGLRALSIRQDKHGPETLVAGTLNNLGGLYRLRGQYDKAIEYYQKALEIRERLYGPDSLAAAFPLTNLSTFYYYKGDYAGALKLDLRVLDIRRKNLKPDHPDIANALQNVALGYSELGEFDKAESMFQEALSIIKQNGGTETSDYATVEFNLATLKMREGNWDTAKPLFQHSLAVAKSKKDDDPLVYALYASGLGEMEMIESDYDDAEKLLLESLEIREKYLGPNNIDVEKTCDLLVRLYVLKGDLDKATKYQTQASLINEKSIALNLAMGTEHQKLSYMDLVAEDLNQAIALQAKFPKNSKGIGTFAVTGVLQQKGRVLDAVSSSMSFLRERATAGDRKLFDRLNDVNAQLSSLQVNSSGDLPPDRRKQKIDALTEVKDKLETDISKVTSGYFENSRPITLAAIQTAIPDDAALIEFANYHPIKAKPDTNRNLRDDDERYVAYVIRREGEPQFVDLGTCREIDEMLSGFRAALRDPSRKDAESLARSVDQKIMQPIRELSGNAKHFLISPDGELSLIPFEALVDGQGHFLIENFSFTYLTSGRDLLRMAVQRESKAGPLIIANPDFGTPDRPAVVKTSNTGRRKPSVTTLRSMSDAYFAPLSGTAIEGQSIKELFPDAKLLTGTAASKAALKQTTAPRILHIASHGFFIGGDQAANKTADSRSSISNLVVENPLLRSGLAFAGANKRSTGDGGILTALEASGLDLWGTKLVVLSACDTGIGEIRTGEGVYGLRRSFVEAGAESLVMSLWPVSDVFTRDMMINYYKNLKDGKGRGEALRQVQIAILNRPGRRHPFYWASFIVAGDWRGLNTKP